MTDPSPVLLVTADAALTEDVRRLASAVGVAVDVHPDGEAVGPAWSAARAILLGADAAAVGAPSRRPGVVLVARDGSDAVWRLAVEAGAEAVARLPDDQAWLVERLACAVDGPATSGRVVGVVGGRGGAGASTLAAGLAAAASWAGLSTLLVDGDPGGGGLDLLLGLEAEPGLRWVDLRDVRGVLRAAVLHDGLPVADGVRLLSHGRGDLGPVPVAALEAVLDAGRRGHDVVVTDLQRTDDPATTGALRRLDACVLVVPAEVRASAAAAVLAPHLRRHVADVRLVVRGPAPTGLAAEVVADTVGLPLAAVWPDDPRLAVDGDHGRAPGRRPGSSLARLARRLLAELAEADAAAPRAWRQAVA